jgi:hypothetical protein
MECLDNFIGLKGCSQEVPESGFHVNGLPGMSTELVDNIANSEQSSYVAVWSDVKQRAFLRLKDDVVNYLYNDPENLKPVNFNQVIYQTKKLTKHSHTDVVVAASENYNGVYVKLPESKYVEFYLRELYVYSDTAVDTVLKVFDLNDGTVLYSQDISLGPGLNKTTVNKSFSLRYGRMEIFIGVDTSNFNSVKTYLENYYWYDCDFTCCDNGTVTIQSASLPLIESGIYSNLDINGQGKGVAIGAEVRCSVEDFICDNRRQLTRAIWYLLGSEMLMQKMGSSRLNYFTASNLEQTNFLMESFAKDYKKALKTALDSIPTEKSLCFDCNDVFEVGYKGNMP